MEKGHLVPQQLAAPATISVQPAQTQAVLPIGCALMLVANVQYARIQADFRTITLYARTAANAQLSTTVVAQCAQPLLPQPSPQTPTAVTPAAVLTIATTLTAAIVLFQQQLPLLPRLRRRQLPPLLQLRLPLRLPQRPRLQARRRRQALLPLR